MNYRLGALPANNPFPTQELDIKTAVDFIYNNRADYLISDKYVLMGASAGGHLSLLHAYKYTNPVKIKAVVDFLAQPICQIYTTIQGLPNSSTGTFIKWNSYYKRCSIFIFKSFNLCFSNKFTYYNFTRKFRPFGKCQYTIFTIKK
ncbi:MAG: alpha/beta hydrolase fold domain-containing protein [Chitinophagaceae bacterium]|nr:alpha/beta hydrolase fold domain-containing protein [Chitinophagaceae bacterium]